MILRPELVYVEEGVAESHVTRRILAALGDVPRMRVDDTEPIGIEADGPEALIQRSKRRLLLARKNGDLVKTYMQTSGALSADEHYIIHGHNCPFDCEYCFLQGYFGHFVPTIFVNQDEVLQAIRETACRADGGRAVFHAGELCDSLVFDDLTGFAPRLVDAFRELPNAMLELRTKSTCVGNLLRTSPAANVIVSWTFAPDVVCRQYEHGAPSFEERLQAARACQRAGYRIGIRLDPMIRCEGWRDHYREMLCAIFGALSHEGLDVVAGCFRFLPQLEKAIRARRPGCRLLLDEFVPCADGKRRYLRKLRTEMYEEVLGSMRSLDGSVKVRICMETASVMRRLASRL